jgi:hypothetical protein
MLVVAVLCVLFGARGVLYAAGLQVISWLTDGIAALFDPKTFATSELPLDSK